MTTTAREPRWLLDDAIRRARTAYRLATKYSATLTPRLSAGLLVRLAADRTLLGDATARGNTALGDRKTATRHERELAADGHDLILAIRNAAKRTEGAPEALLTALGVGDALTSRDTQGVLAGLRAIVANAVPLGSCGVGIEEITEAQHLADDLFAADSSQGERTEDRTATTETRRDAQLRLEAAVAEISARGALALRKDTVVRSRFERLVATAGPTAEDVADAGPEPAQPAAATPAGSPGSEPKPS